MSRAWIAGAAAAVIAAVALIFWATSQPTPVAPGDGGPTMRSVARPDAKTVSPQPISPNDPRMKPFHPRTKPDPNAERPLVMPGQAPPAMQKPDFANKPAPAAQPPGETPPAPPK